MSGGKRILVLLALALFASVGAGLWAMPEARAEVTISVSPSMIEFEAVPGNVGEQEITVFNDGDEPFSVTAVVRDYGGAPAEFSARDWIQVSPESFDLAPGENQVVRANINVPSDARTGGGYAVVAFKTGARSSGSGTGVSGELGVPQLFTVKGAGTVDREAKIDRILPELLNDGTIGFQVKVDNPGNIHYFPRGTMEVTCQGGPSETLEVPRSTAVVPGNERFLAVNGALDIPPEATCDARTVLDYGAGQRVEDVQRVQEGRQVEDELGFRPEARLEIQDLAARENPGLAPDLSLALDNGGELLLRPEVRFDVFDQSATLLGGANPAQPPVVEPGERVDVKVAYPGRLGPGEYILRASATYGDGRIAEAQTTFTLGSAAQQARPGAPDVAGSWWTWWMILGLILLLLVLIALAIRYLPPFRPLRRRIGRAWKALRQSDDPE